MALSKSRRRGGLTLIEVFIASIILTAIVGISAYVVWSSSRHTETTEAALQLEISAREFLNSVVKELHQTKITTIRKVDTTLPIQVDSTTLNLLATPGTPAASISYFDPLGMPGSLGPPVVPAVPPTPHSASDFDGIRFRLPGYVLDLTKNNANADNNSKLPVEKQMFDLKAYKANADASAWLYEVQYWWEIDNTTTVAEGTAGGGPKGLVRDGADNNKNGVVDEGVVYKLETWYNTDGTLQKRSQSVVCRNVKSLTFLPNRAWNGTDWGGTIYAGGPRQIVASVTLERADPKYPNTPARNIVKTVSTVIDLRN
jgi:type II secretory pathway component PulJ